MVKGDLKFDASSEYKVKKLINRVGGVTLLRIWMFCEAPPQAMDKMFDGIRMG